MTIQPRTFDTDKSLLEFLSDYCEFGADRVYLLLAMARPKENEAVSHGNALVFREIITDEGDMSSKYARLKTVAHHYETEEGQSLNFRFYLTANARDTRKSFYLYQKDLIEYGHKMATGHEQTHEKIKRLDKEWKSKLQSDSTKDDSFFIIDVDTEDKETYKKTLSALKDETDILTAIRSPNGFHIITVPFNYPDFELLNENDQIEIKTDGLMFLCLFN